MMNQHYAHTRKDSPVEDWQLLIEHLDAVAALAAQHASAFGSAAWGELAGRWHDLGKYAPDWQNYLKSFATDPEVGDASILDGNKSGRVDHSSAGAVHVLARCVGRLGGSDGDELPGVEAALAMVIAGHHSGLPKRLGFESGRLAEKWGRLAEARRGAPVDLLGVELPSLPDPLRPESFSRPGGSMEKRLRLEFWTRMLFSALIDADRLDTEWFMDETKHKDRIESKVAAGTLEKLGNRVDAHIDQVNRTAKERVNDLPESARSRAEAVLMLRAVVLDACRQAALRPPGRYSLTVPTGGGKTLASLAFALRHAQEHGLRRVIVVIPFTSIIDQTAEVYRKAFGDDLAGALVEHHSNLDPVRESVGNRLASENWDAPVIVTTSVQFFESLFSSRGTAARKLHNIARSVVVFDEVQTLPHHLRTPLFDVLNQLVDHYGVSALFCTATQPALELKEVNRQDFPYLTDVREVIPDVPALFGAVADRVVADFRRVDVSMTWEDLAAEVKTHDRVLVIVQRRDDARDLCRLLPEGSFHLSALMCAAHRREVLSRIDAALKGGKPCRVVATTLVEAGVDLDFPIVYRALGGVDALAQAAGRCNREGRLVDDRGRPIPGRLIVFRAPTDPPRGLQLAADTTAILLKERGHLDLFDPRTYQSYFARYLAEVTPDREDVMKCRAARDFPEVEARFRMIEDEGQVSIVVPYQTGGDQASEVEKRLDRYRDRPNRETLRALQPYIVNVSRDSKTWFDRNHLIEVIHDQVLWLNSTGSNQYDPIYGLDIIRVAPSDPASLMV